MVEPYVSLAERQQQSHAARRALRERFLQRRREPPHRTPSALEPPTRSWEIETWEINTWGTGNEDWDWEINTWSNRSYNMSGSSNTWQSQHWNEYASRRYWREVQLADNGHHAWAYVPVRTPARERLVEFRQRHTEYAERQVEHRRHLDAMIDEVGRRERHSIEVQNRAWTLLKEHLDPAESSELDLRGEFVITSQHGRRYLIRTHHYEHNVFLLSERGHAVEELCVRIGETGMPLADHLLAQVLGLRFNEDWIRNIANITPMNGHRYGGDRVQHAV